MKNVNVSTVCARWRDPTARPLFKGSLISGGFGPDDPVCRCAQGDVLHLAGWSDDDLRSVEQAKADRAVAELLSIPLAQAILLRRVNDSADGCPQDVLDHPERVLGDQAVRVLAFWRYLDSMMPADWCAVIAARDAAGDAAVIAAKDASWYAAGAAAKDASWVAARAATKDASWVAAWAAAGATNEIQGAAELKPLPFFLPMFKGFTA